MILAKIIAEKIRENGLDVSWNDEGQIRIVTNARVSDNIPPGVAAWHLVRTGRTHRTFTIIGGIIHCGGGRYSLFDDRPIEEFVIIAHECLERRWCNGCKMQVRI